MATRQKTIVFAFPTDVNASTDATVTNLTQITIYIPEASPVFRSVYVELGFQDIITATGGDIGEHRCGLRLGAAGYTTVTETDDIVQTGENIGGVLGPFDFTAHFTTNWTGTSMTCDVQYYFDHTSGTTLGVRNATATVTITYEYDDSPSTNATQIKTVAIPLESLVGALSTSANAQIGTNQIPILTGGSGILPENSVTIRDYFFVIEGNEATSATTDWTLTANIDSGGSPFSFGAQEAALNSARYCRWIYKPSVPTTTSVHAFQLWAVSTARANHVTITLFVTYEFNASATTRVLNSVFFPLDVQSPLGTTSSAEASRFKKEFFIEDPGTITLRQSSFRINFTAQAAVGGLQFRAGSQSYRSYTHVGSVTCGMYSLQQRIDSGGAQGAGISIARGLNSFTIDGFTTDGTDFACNVSGWVILNYESDIGTEGPGQNTHTVWYSVSQWDAALVALTRVNNFAIPIPETYYWICAVGLGFMHWTSARNEGQSVDVEILSGEADGAGYKTLWADTKIAVAERACEIIWFDAEFAFKRHPNDPQSHRVDIETARDFRMMTSATGARGLFAFVTYHGFKFFAHGALTDYTGDGSGISVKVYRTDNDEFLIAATSIAGGDFEAYVYDNTIDLKCEARQSSSRVGRSDNGKAALKRGDIMPTGIASAAAFGTAVISYDQIVSPGGIASAEAFGTTIVSTDATASFNALATWDRLHLRTSGGPSESAGAVTGWPEANGGSAATLSGNAPVYRADPLGNGSGPSADLETNDKGFVTGVAKATNTNWSTFIVVRPQSLVVGGENIIGDSSGTDLQLYFHNTELRILNNAGLAVVDTVVANTVYRLILTCDGTNLRVYVNGSLEATHSVGSTVTTTLEFGSTGANTENMLGDIFCFGIASNFLTGGDITTLDGLLQAEIAG